MGRGSQQGGMGQLPPGGIMGAFPQGGTLGQAFGMGQQSPAQNPLRYGQSPMPGGGFPLRGGNPAGNNPFPFLTPPQPGMGGFGGGQIPAPGQRPTGFMGGMAPPAQPSNRAPSGIGSLFSRTQPMMQRGGGSR